MGNNKSDKIEAGTSDIETKVSEIQDDIKDVKERLKKYSLIECILSLFGVGAVGALMWGYFTLQNKADKIQQI